MIKYVKQVIYVALLLFVLAAGNSHGQDSTCRFSVTPNNIEFFDVYGGTVEIKVTASAPTCRFTVVSRYPWITATVKQEGAEGIVLVKVDSNDSLTHRVGELTVAGHKVNVIQPGPRRGGDSS